MKIEAVVTCVHYADFLAETLPHNRAYFDQLVVVTAPEDRDTRTVCDMWNVRCILTDVFRSRWGEFCKGAAINRGLRELEGTDWMVHMDADIMMPSLTRQTLDEAKLDPQCVYGVDRYMVPNSKAWHAFKSSPKPQLDNGIFVQSDHFPKGSRIVTRQFGGYIPIGYFQLWNAASGITSYPEGHTDAAREDVAFAAKWPRSRRHLIPELIAYHLESEPVEMGTNWGGRKTKPFNQ